MLQPTKAHLDKTRFARHGAGGKQKITLVFPNWHKPDDYDKYKEWQEQQEFNKAGAGVL